MGFSESVSFYFRKKQKFSLKLSFSKRKLEWKYSFWMLCSSQTQSALPERLPAACFSPIIQPDPSLPSRSSSPLPVLWRSAPTTLFLIWKVSPFHAAHLSSVPPIRVGLYRSLSQSCLSHVLLRTAHLPLWTLMWNYLPFPLSCIYADFI